MKFILVVDDEPTIREVIADTLRDAEYRVETAFNGAEALQHMHHEVPDAVVLDLMMPTLDAQGLVELMRLNPRLRMTPILVVTASYGAADAARRLGARGYLTKPFELDDLVELVRAAVDRPAPLPVASNGMLEPKSNLNANSRPIIAEA